MTREYRVKHGICVDCPKPVVGAARRCMEHTLRNREMSRTYKQRCIEAKKAAGICFNCNLPAVVGMRRCEKHLDAASKYITDRGYRYRQEAETTAPRLSPLDRKLSALGRCKCGLLLPCVCLPSVYEVASNRRDAE